MYFPKKRFSDVWALHVLLSFVSSVLFSVFCVFLFCSHSLIVESICVLVTSVDSYFGSIFVDKHVSGELT